MTFYHQQLINIRQELYSKEYLCEQVKLAKNFIDSHFHEMITLQDMAAHACFSKFHFFRLFKTLYGKTPFDYLKEVRISHAKKLLRTGLPVSEVSILVGFNSSTSFSGLFKKMTGMSPSRFQLRSVLQLAVGSLSVSELHQRVFSPFRRL
jgi:AraC-like DNA-binding protein